ncbi:MAG TPA: nucleotidyltransferase family protein [Planctomycetota bacterium]|nr:nucleotidyltransferase family protein [Planctomycetota bacterium]
MHALILGAGYATRLYPLTVDRPKPLLPVGGVPILQRICGQIASAGKVEKIHVVTNHRFASHYEQWLKEYGSRNAPRVPIVIHDDQTTTPENRLGAIGDLQFVLEKGRVDDDLVVIAGDNLISGSLTPFLECGRSKGAAVGLKDLRSKQLVSLYGVVETDSENRVVGFQEKPAEPRSTLIAVGLYYFPRATLPLVRTYLDLGSGKDAPGYYLQWLHRRIPVYGHVLDGEWFDIGDLDSYHRADEAVKRKEAS